MNITETSASSVIDNAEVEGNLVESETKTHRRASGVTILEMESQQDEELNVSTA